MSVCCIHRVLVWLFVCVVCVHWYVFLCVCMCLCECVCVCVIKTNSRTHNLSLRKKFRRRHTAAKTIPKKARITNTAVTPLCIGSITTSTLPS